jgi:hypothetical protein
MRTASLKSGNVPPGTGVNLSAERRSENGPPLINPVRTICRTKAQRAITTNESAPRRVVTSIPLFWNEESQMQFGMPQVERDPFLVVERSKKHVWLHGCLTL